MSHLFSDGLINYIIVFFAALVAYVISTLSGGGGSLLLVPVINFFLGVKETAPILNLGNLVGEPVRIVLFWNNIEWQVVKFYLPSAIAGAVFGAWIFSNIKLEWLQIIIALFLISTLFQYRFGNKERSFKMTLTWFLPLGFFVEFFSSLIGATGPILNPFYLNYGLQKEKLIATKTINSFFIGLIQITTYSALGSLKGNLWFYGIILGIGASVGNWVGKTFLKKITNALFKKIVIAVMVISGITMIVRQLMSFSE
jgi:uncharacterized membrane protein YfcA